MNATAPIRAGSTPATAPSNTTFQNTAMSREVAESRIYARLLATPAGENGERKD
jgi:hypothetical protein